MGKTDDKKEDVKNQLRELRSELRRMHLSVTEELLLPEPVEVKDLMSKMDNLLKTIDD